jgi:hypothetical protein
MPTANVLLTIEVHTAKMLQDLAYMTYAHNIQLSKDLDTIFANCPGYLERSQRA